MYTAIAVKNGYYTVLCKPCPKSRALKFAGCELEDEDFKVMKVQTVLNHPHVVGKEYLKAK